ncbi:hypothetical protein JCM16303_003886 [Sporobolomyces ruberrimus]
MFKAQPPPKMLSSRQVVEHLIPTLDYLPPPPRLPARDSLELLKHPSRDIEPEPPAYTIAPCVEEEPRRESNWTKFGKTLRLMFCGAYYY